MAGPSRERLPGESVIDWITRRRRMDEELSRLASSQGLPDPTIPPAIMQAAQNPTVQRIMEARTPAEPTAAQSYSERLGDQAFWTGQDPAQLEEEQRAEEGEGDSGVFGPATGILGRVFDIASRPNYAIAELVRRVNEEQRDPSGNALTDIASGVPALWQGLSGQKKTSFDKVLGEGGVSGGWQRALAGLALDIGTDPTTYVGVGAVRGAAKGGAMAQAGRKGTKEFAKEVAKKKGNTAYTRQLRKELNDIRKAEGLKSKVRPAQVEREIERRTLKHFIDEDKINSTVDNIMVDNPGSLQLKFAGMPIFNSKSMYRVGRRVADAVGEGKDGPRLLNRMFNPNAEMPEGLNDLLRQGVIANEGDFARKIQGMKSIFEDLTPEARAEINFALDEGISLADQVVDGKFGKNLEEYRQAAKNIYERLWDEEVSLGLVDPDQKIDNYTKRIFKNATDKQKKEANKFITKNLVGPKSAGFQAERSFKKTLREAANDGLDPVTDVMDSLAQRLSEHFQLKSSYMFFDEATKRFGQNAKKLSKSQKKLLENTGFKLWKPGKGLKGALNESYVPEHIHKALTLMEQVNTSDDAAKELLKHIDKATAWMKFGMTSVNPGFHVRNSMTDIVLNLSDGVNNPKRYYDGMKVMRRRQARAQAQEWASQGKHLDVPKPETIRVGKSNLTDEDVYNLFISGGGKSGYIKAELDQFLSKGAAGGKLSKAKSKVADLSEAREDYFRLVHFIHALDDEAKKLGVPLKRGKTLIPQAQEIARNAARRVRKFNLDYGNKTQFERKIASRVMPFYTWARKNTALQVSLLLTKPGVAAMYPKTQRAVQNMLGADENGNTLIPEWMKELAPIRLATEGKLSPISGLLSAFGVKPGQAALLGGQTFPIADLQRLDPIVGNLAEGKLPDIGTAVGELMGESHPFIKAPAEAATGRYMFSGAPIGSPQEWLSNQMPASRQVYNANAARQGEDNGFWAGLARYATGLDIRPITDNMQQSEFRRREDGIEQIIRRRREQELRRLIALQNQQG